MDDRTVVEFGCDYTLEEKYQLAMSGEYCVFELFSRDGDVSGYRGTRKGYGVTGVWPTYREAFEAAIIEMGPKSGVEKASQNQ